uniref:C2 domain-containing protein n=1 Tax=Globisporangium ultimum (strain ATCC 200006 / CBS 805.95 / DAOM BR144) TaxID=431595 RepID=K3WHW5_GLOUD
MPVLYVKLHRATDLAASDFSFMGGKSDPYVLVEVERQQEKSACIKSNLNPVWSPAERFRFDIEDVNRAVLGVKVFDYDALNQDDLLGSLVIPLSRFANMMDQSFLEVFALDVPAEFAKQDRPSTIELEICLKNEDDGDTTLTIWENETWSIGSGWSAADSKDRQQWSTHDESKSSAHFNDVAPLVPSHLEGGGWEYCAKKGDMNGWVYATSWAERHAQMACSHVVRVTLTHATRLAQGDYIGKSDPYIKFTVDEQSARSSCRASTLDPVWDPPEHFDFKVLNPEEQCVRVDVFDHDLITRDDHLGSVSIPLKDFITEDTNNALPDAATTGRKELPPSKGYTLDVPPSLKTVEPSQVFLRIAVTPLDLTEVRLEVWENECWSLSSGWSSDVSIFLFSHRTRWSNEDGSHSATKFEEIAAKPPLGFQSQGWNFHVGKGDCDGWLYAVSFSGPWYAVSNPTTLVRHRRWENMCRRPGSTKILT